MTDPLAMPASIVGKIEDGILGLLKDAMPPRFLIEGFPDDPGEFDLANIERAALVHYVGSKYRDAEAIETGESKRMLQYGVHLYIRSVGKGDPARQDSYRAVEDTRQALQGQRLQGGALTIVSDELAEQDGGLWHWVVEVSIGVKAVAPRRQVRPMIKAFSEKGAVA